MPREWLEQRYRYLWTGEAAAILVFVLLFLYTALADGEGRNWIARAYSLSVVVTILLQGIVWWRWKLRMLQTGQRTMPKHVLSRFRRFKWVNWLLIVLFPLVIWLKWWLTGAPWRAADTWWGLLFLGGAILEQINYYYAQLMYDNRYDWRYLRSHRQLRPGSIGKALAQV